MTCLLVSRVQQCLTSLARSKFVLCLGHKSRIALYREYEYENCFTHCFKLYDRDLSNCLYFLIKSRYMYMSLFQISVP